jgi:hypothetical protein
LRNGRLFAGLFICAAVFERARLRTPSFSLQLIFGHGRPDFGRVRIERNEGCAEDHARLFLGALLDHDGNGIDLVGHEI